MENLIGVGIFLRRNVVEDHAWLVPAQHGERWALEQFFNCYQPHVYSLCHRLLGRAEDAEDATQATFVNAFAALPKFRGGSQVKTWLYRIAVNEALSVRRRRKNAPTPLEETAARGSEIGQIEERLAVARALNGLQPEHRAILVLRFWEELSYEEIAVVLQVSLPAVKMRLSRARAQFQKAYEVNE